MASLKDIPVDVYKRQDIRSIAFVGFRVEILDVLTREFLMLGQVKISTVVNTFYFLETERHQAVSYTHLEYVTGSSRMKSGTGQKMILNMITTSVMIQLGLSLIHIWKSWPET